MRRKYMALFLAAVTAVSQVAGATSVAGAADLIIEEPVQLSEEEFVEGADFSDVEIFAVEGENAAAEVQEVPEELSESMQLPEMSEEDAKDVPEETEVLNETVEDVSEEREPQEKAAGDESEETGVQDETADKMTEEAVEEVPESNAGEDMIAENLVMDDGDFLMSIEVLDESLAETLELAEEGTEGEQPSVWIDGLRNGEENCTWFHEGETQQFSVNMSQFDTETEYRIEWNLSGKEREGENSVDPSEYIRIDSERNSKGLTLTALKQTNAADDIILSVTVWESENNEELAAYAEAYVDVCGNWKEEYGFDDGIWSNTGTHVLLPGDSIDLTAQFWRHCYMDEENPEHYFDGDLAHVRYEWSLSENAPFELEECYENGEYGQTSCSVAAFTPAENQGYEGVVTVTAYLTDESGYYLTDESGEVISWSVSQNVYISEGYYNLLPAEHQWNANLNLGESVDYYPNFQWYYKGSDASGNEVTIPEPVEGVRYYWYSHDPEAIEVVDLGVDLDSSDDDMIISVVSLYENDEGDTIEGEPDGIHYGAGPFRITKKKNVSTDLVVVAGVPVEENGEVVYNHGASRHYWLQEQNYDIWFEREVRGEDYSWIFTDESLELVLNTDNLNGREGVSVSCYLDGSETAYAKDTNRLILSAEELLNSGYQVGNIIRVSAEAEVNGYIVSADEFPDIEIVEPYEELRLDHDYQYGLETLPNREHWLGRNLEYHVFNKETVHERGYDGIIRNIEILNENDEPDNSVLVYKEHEDGYNLRTQNYGYAKVKVTYELHVDDSADGPVYEDANEPYCFEVFVNGENYSADIASSTGVWSLHPGEGLELEAHVNGRFWNRENGEQDINIEDALADGDISVEWSWDESYEDIADIETGENNPFRCNITAKEEGLNEDMRIQFRVYDRDGNVRAECERHIWIGDVYYKVEASPNLNRYRELKVGETVTVNPVLIKYERIPEYDGNGEEIVGYTTQESIVNGDEITWRWENWDTNILKITDSNGDELSHEMNTGTAPFTLEKRSNNYTDIRVAAYLGEEQEWAADDWWSFGSISYDTWFEGLREHDYTWIYTDGSDDAYMISLNDENLYGRSINIEWEIGYRGEEGIVSAPVGENEPYMVSEDGLNVSLNGSALDDWLRSEEAGNRFVIRAAIYLPENDEEVWSYEIEAETLEAYRDNPCGYQDEEYRIAGEGLWIDTYCSYYEENGNYPYGCEHGVVVTDVQVELAEGSPENAIEYRRVTQDRNGWDFYFAEECEAYITVSYMRTSDAEEMEYTIHLIVGSQYADVWFEGGNEERSLFVDEPLELNVHADRQISFEEYEEDLTNAVFDWALREGSEEEFIMQESSENGLRNDSWTIQGNTADREAVVAAIAYLCETDEEGNIAVDAEGNPVRVQYLGESELRIRVGACKIEEAEGQVTEQEQYLQAEYGESVAIHPILMLGDAPYEGDIHYRWDYNGDQLRISEDELWCTAEDEISFEITKTNNDYRAYARLYAEVCNEDGEWYEVARKEWFFNCVDNNIWFETDRDEDGTAWVFSDETDYTLKTGQGENLFASGKKLLWTVGLCTEEGFLEDYYVPESTAEADGIYTVSEDTGAITLNGEALNEWIKTIEQEDEDRPDEEKILYHAGLCIQAQVVRPVPIAAATELAEETVVWEPVEGESTTIGMGLRVEEPYDEWEDQHMDMIYTGKSFYYDGSIYHRWVKDQNHPWENEYKYLLTDIDSSDESVLETVYDEENDSWRIRAVKPGEADITYYYLDQNGNEQTSGPWSKTVEDKRYHAETDLEYGTNLMLAHSSSQLLDVKVYAVDSLDENGEEIRIPLSPYSYQVDYTPRDHSILSVEPVPNENDNNNPWLDQAGREIMMAVPHESGETSVGVHVVIWQTETDDEGNIVFDDEGNAQYVLDENNERVIAEELDFPDIYFNVFNLDFTERYGGDHTWMFDNSAFTLTLDHADLLKEMLKNDNMSIQWEAGYFYEEDSVLMAEGTEENGQYTVSEDGLSITFDGPAVREWAETHGDENGFSVNATVIYSEKYQEKVEKWWVGNADTWVGIDKSELRAPGDLNLEEYRLGGTGHFMDTYTGYFERNAEHPHGYDWEAVITDVAVQVQEGPQKAVTCTRVQNEHQDGWELQFNNDCQAIITISFIRTADGARMTQDVHVTVGSEDYNVWIEEGSAQKYMTPGETMSLSAQVSHDIAYDASVMNPEYTAVKWSIPESNGILTFEENAAALDEGASSEQDNITVTAWGPNCTVQAMEECGSERVLAEVYLYERDEDGKLVLDEKDNPILTDECVAEIEVWIEVSDYKVSEYVNENAGITPTDQEQYLLPGESITIYPILTDRDGEEYEGTIHYRWEWEGDLEITPNNMEVASTAEDQNEDTRPSFVITSHSENWAQATLVAEIFWMDEEENEHRQEFRRQWFFHGIDRNLWFENIREEDYTWIYDDDDSYTMSVGIGDGLLEDGRTVEWTIGMLRNDSFIESAVVPYDENGSDVYSISDERSITINGTKLKEWYNGLSARDRRDAGLHVQARVVLNADEEDYAEQRIYLELRENAAIWEDSQMDTLLMGKQFYYDNSEFSCTVINKDHPNGDKQIFTLVKPGEELKYEDGTTVTDANGTSVTGIISSNEEVLKPEYDEQNNRWTITACAPGEAEITYYYWIDRDNGIWGCVPVMKYVTDTYFGADVMFLSGTNRMVPGDSQQILLNVYKRQVKENGEEERISYASEDYSVRYESTDHNRITVTRDGMVTASPDRNYGQTWVNVYITIPQYAEDGSELEPVELEYGVDFYIQDYYYQISAEPVYRATAGESFTIDPKVYLMEPGMDPVYFEDAEFEVAEADSEYLDSIVKNADGTFTISTKDSEECAAYIRITAQADKDDYGYELYEETVSSIVFCAHRWGEAFDVQDSDCEKEGYYSHTCEKCGLTERETIQIKEHSWDSGVITTPPTCAKEGIRTYTCTECTTAFYTEKVMKTNDHTPGNWITTKAATCTATGTQVQKCTVCGTQTASRTLAMPAHTPGSWTTTKAATCTAAGTQVQKCSVCGTVVNTKAIPAKGHSWGAYTVTKQPTAVEEGWQVRKCSCGASEGVAVAKLTPTIKLTATKLNLQLKKSATIKSIVTGLAAGDSIASWKSSNAKIVTVNSSGKITGKKIGSANITVTLKSGKTASVKVTVQKKAVATTKITVENAASRKVTLNKGKSMTLIPVITQVTSLEKVTYKTSNKKVVTVTSKGKITAKASGKATITVKSGKKSVKITVTVPKVQPTKISGIPASKTLKKGKTLTLKPKLLPAGSEATIKYSTSDKKVAAVTSKGKITAKKKGKAVITVKAGKVTAKCTITVK